MPGTQIRSHKAKTPLKSSGRSVMVAAKPKQDSSEVRPGSGSTISAQERERFVAQAAYYRAEKRGFAPGYELQDWVEAEAEVLRLIGGA